MKSIISLVITSLSAAGQIWIAPGPTNAGTGTINGNGTAKDPYYGDLDLIVSNTAASYTITHLLPGVYWTRNLNLLFRDGDRFVGSGKYQTVIRRDNAIPRSGPLTLLGGYANNSEVGDLTLDVNATNQEQWQFNGLVLIGSNNLAHDIRVINATGNSSNSLECFQIFLSGPRNIITRCNAESFQGDYCTAIATTGDITFCSVQFPAITNLYPPTLHAYGGDANIEFCECYGGGAGWYTDGAWLTNVSCRFNNFRNVFMGVDIAEANNSGVDGLQVTGNVIELSPLSTNSPFSGGIRLWGNAALANASVSDNLVRGQSNQIAIWILDGTNTINTKVLNNTFSPGMVEHFGKSPVFYSGNTDTFGNSVRKQ